MSASKVDELEAVASDVAQRNVPLVNELYESNGRAFNLQVLVTDILGKHGCWFQVEGNVNLTHGWLTLRHGYGLKWSKFLRAYLVSARAALSNDKLDIRIGDQFVRVGFKTNHEKAEAGHEQTFGDTKLSQLAEVL